MEGAPLFTCSAFNQSSFLFIASRAAAAWLSSAAARGDRDSGDTEPLD